MPAAPEREELLRRWLRRTLPPRQRGQGPLEMPSDARRALDWMGIHSLPLRAISRSRCEAAYQAALRNLDGSEARPNTFIKRRTAITRLLNAAVSKGHLGASPAAGIRMRRRQSANRQLSRSEIPTVAEAQRLTIVCGMRSPQARRLVAYLAVTLYAGLRPGEVNALRPADVDLPEDGWGELRVQRSRTITSKGLTDDRATTAEGEPKTGVSRVVPLHPDAVALVRLHMALWPGGARDPIFVNAKGGVLNSNIDRVLDDAKEHLGWVGGHRLAPTHRYTLRHTAASAAIGAGLPLPEVANRLGHSVDELMRTYWHVINTDEAEMNLRLERAYGRHS